MTLAALPYVSDLSSTRRVLLLIGVLLFSCHTIYFESLGFPIVPMLGLALVVACSGRWLLRSSGGENRNTAIGVCLALTLLILISALWGQTILITPDIKAPVGMLGGILILLTTLLGGFDRRFLSLLLWGLQGTLVVHLSAFFFQYLFHMATGEFFDFVQLLCGTTTRFQSGFARPRFTGLFVEPANYACFAFQCLTVRLFLHQLSLRRLDVLVLASIFLTSSVTGFFLGSCALLLVFAGSKSKLRTLFWLLTAALVVFLADTSGEAWEFMASRIAAPTDDPSGNARLSIGWEVFLQNSELIQIVGIGIGNFNEEILDSFGNTYFFLLHYFGYLGTSVFGAILIWLFTREKLPVGGIVAVFASLFSAPILTIFFWWFWCALLIHAARRGSEESPAQQGYSPAGARICPMAAAQT